MRRRRIAVVTGTRAEYGLLAPLMRLLKDDPAVELQLIVTGAHLSERFGMTVTLIETDGFTIDARVSLPLDGDSPLDMARAMAAGVAGIAEAIERLTPDIVVLLGDRFEILAAAQAAFITRRILGHIHGGEATEGALDDGFRHAITKLAHLHFVSAEPYRRRVVQMGENPERVWIVGAPGLDAIAETKFLDRDSLDKSLRFELGPRFLLVTYHPVTLDENAGAAELEALLAALDAMADAKILITGHNADAGHGRISALLDAFAAERPERVFLAASLGQQRYLSAMKFCAAVVGNSSSGLIEAPALGVPTVNVGDRQKGRLRGESVIDCTGTPAAIADALNRAVSSTFQACARTAVSPYGNPGASARMARILKGVPLAGLARKPFFDLAAGVTT